MVDLNKLAIFGIAFFGLVFVLMTWSGAVISGSWLRGFLVTMAVYVAVAILVIVVFLGVLWAYNFDLEAFNA